jgi:hypothetical protein
MKKKTLKIRNGIVLAMLGRKGSKFKDKRLPKGGGKNKFQEILKDQF